MKLHARTLAAALGVLSLGGVLFAANAERIADNLERKNSPAQQQGEAAGAPPERIAQSGGGSHAGHDHDKHEHGEGHAHGDGHGHEKEHEKGDGHEHGEGHAHGDGHDHEKDHEKGDGHGHGAGHDHGDGHGHEKEHGQGQGHDHGGGHDSHEGHDHEKPAGREDRGDAGKDGHDHAHEEKAKPAARAALSAAKGGKEEHAGHGHGEAAGDGHGHAEEDAHAHGEEGVVRLSAEESSAIGVELQQARRQLLKETLDLPAEIRLHPDRVAKVSTPVDGIVLKLEAGVGDVVATGDKLAVVASREIAGLVGDLLSARSETALARAENTRETTLFQRGNGSELNVDRAKAKVATSEAAVAAALARLKSIGLSADDVAVARESGVDALSQYTLKAPIAGTIAQTDLTVGQSLRSEAGDVLFLIVDTKIVWAEVAVFSADLDEIRTGANVELVLDSGRSVSGVVNFVSPLVEEASRTSTARVIAQNETGLLRPGQLVVARIEKPSRERSLTVPAGAVQTVHGRPVVFAPVEGGFKARPVAVGRRVGDLLEVKSGLSDGDSFVAKGSFTLKAELEKAGFGDGHNH